MKHLYRPAAALAALLFVTCLSSCHSGRSSGPLGAPADLGSEEDADARQTYEWMMLHDPATGKIPAGIREKELAFAATLPDDASFGYQKGTAINWQPRGPWNVGGRTRAFAIDVTNPAHFVAGSASGGMYQSSDGGQSWTNTTPANQNLSVSCLTQDTRPGHTSVWYYGSGEAYGASASANGASYQGSGIYKSTDGGASWAVLPATTTANTTTFDVWGDYVWNIVTNPADMNADVVYAAAYGGIYKSVNGGTTWALAKGNFTGVSVSYFTDVAISSTGVIYATLSSDGPQRGIYRSTDGVNFANITPDSFPASYRRVKIGISPSDENQVYFLGNTPGEGLLFTNYTGTQEWNSLWKYTYISGDGSGAGGAWANRSLNLPSGGGPFDGFNSQSSYDLVVKVKPNDPNTVFIGGTNLYRSTTGFADTAHTTFIGGYVKGATLPVVNSYPNHHPDQHEIAFLPNPDMMISANDGGIFRTADNTAPSVSWTPLNNGYITTMFYTCAIDHASTNDIIVGGAQDNGSWFTNSAVLTNPWVTPRGGDGSWCAIADNSSAYYLSIQNGKMMKAKLNAAGGVDSFARIDPIGASSYLFINPYTLDPNNNNLMYLVAGRCLWRNNDLSGIPYASNWDSISTNWVRFPDTLTSGVYTAVAASKTPANRVYVGTSAQRVYRIDNANTGTPVKTLISPTTGVTAFPSGGYVSCIAVDPTNADHVMVVFSNYGVYSLFYSDNGGTSWTKCAGNLEVNTLGSGNGPSVRWASIIPVSGGTVYLVGTSVGLFATSQLNGTSTVWIRQGSGTIGSSVVDMMDFRNTDGLVAVATHSHGMFSGYITDTNVETGIHSNGGIKSALQLTAFPNPFQDAVMLQFTLGRRTGVSLQVYDELGKPVRTLASGEMDAGVHRFRFDGAGLPPGVYYGTLRAGSYSETQKLMLVR